MRAIKVFAHLGCSLRFCPALANSATANRVTSFLGIACFNSKYFQVSLTFGVTLNP